MVLGIYDKQNGLQNNNIFGLPTTETASMAYDGTLLPAGAGVDPTKRYLKDLGKDKNHVLVESGQGKFFNGSNQYINTGIIPNQAQGTLVTRGTFNGGSGRYLIGANKGGRLYIAFDGTGQVRFGHKGSSYLTPTAGQFVSGSSYHLAMSYVGLDYKCYLNGVLIYSGTSAVGYCVGAMYVGALNANDTAAYYHNSVIDETYYYDVELTDAQIMSLYQYPEKITTNTAGAIVPDIGNEANCKLFLPMSESNNTIGNHTVNVAVAKGTNLATNGTFDTDTLWSKGTGWTISGGKANVSNSGGASYLTRADIAPTIGKRYCVAFTVSNYVAGTVRFTCGGVNGQAVTANGDYVEVFTAVSAVQFSLYGGTTAVCSFDNVSFEEVSAFPIVSFTASCVDSAKQLSYGAQCIAWKRDALGLPTGMSGGLSFDGNKSVKRIDTGYIPLSTVDFAISTIVRTKITPTNQNLGAKNFRLNVTSNGTSSGLYTGSWQATTGALVVNTYNHIMLIRAGTTFYRYLNGVLKDTFTSLTWTSDTTSLMIGDDGFGGTPFYTIIGSIKVWKGVQVSKLVPSKEWAKAQKIIAKLGA